MVSRRGGGRGESEKSKAEEEGGDKGGDYEESRAQRIKENMERMKSLGIADLSNQLKRRPPSSSHRKIKPQLPPSDDPPRRSSRLKEVPLPSYTYNRTRKKAQSGGSSSEKVEIYIPAGEKPEIYTEEHEKLLGDSVADWTLLVDGFDEDGHRIYDPHEGKSCHQCRQKTLGLRTSCSKCSTVSGQFCGDCLYMRYGENVTEVNLNQDWVCPVCRGICNCSRCRRDKGWNPTGAIYRKARKLGFKSVSHYLIHTCREGAIVAAESPSTDDEKEGSSPSTDDEKEGSSDALPQSGHKEHEVPENMEQDSDSEYEGEEE